MEGEGNIFTSVLLSEEATMVRFQLFCERNNFGAYTKSSKKAGIFKVSSKSVLNYPEWVVYIRKFSVPIDTKTKTGEAVSSM